MKGIYVFERGTSIDLLVKAVLLESGFKAKFFPSISAGCDEIRRQSPDLALINLIGLNGYLTSEIGMLKKHWHDDWKFGSIILTDQENISMNNFSPINVLQLIKEPFTCKELASAIKRWS